MRTLQIVTALFLVSIPTTILGQTRQWVSFEVKIADSESGRGIPLVHFQVANSNIGSITNEDGRARLSIRTGSYTMLCSHLAYEPAEYNLNIMSDTLIAVTMKRKTVALQEVRIMGERIQNITPETYTHISDYQTLGEWLILLGHPGKQNQNWLYLAYANGTILDTLALTDPGRLVRDYLHDIWFLTWESAWPVRIIDNRLTLLSPLEGNLFTDTIAPVLLNWNNRKFYQSYFGGDRGLKTFFQQPGDSNSYVFSTVTDTVAQYLMMAQKRDQQVRMIADSYEGSVQSMAQSGGAMGINSSKGSAAVTQSLLSSGQSRYIDARTGQPLIYGQGNVGGMNVIIPEIKNIQAPILLWQNMLIQFDYYSGAIYFFNDRLLKIHQVSIDFHVEKQAGGKLRKKYIPLSDEQNKRMYVWTQRLDQVYLYRLDVETGQLAERINLDRFKNPRNLQIANGALYFLYDEKIYPFNTRLYRMIL